MPKLNLHFFTRNKKAPVKATANLVPNNAGGLSFAVDDWTMLRRFLVLGSEGGTYYVGEAKLTVDNAQAVMRLLLAEPLKVVDEIVAISKSGRSAKNDACLFALAMVAGHANDEGKAAALAALPLVARTATHLFTFVEYAQSFRGWGRGLRRAVANWYTSMPLDRLALQLTKYQQRNGWCHRDLLRLSHAKADDSARNLLFKFAINGSVEGIENPTILAFQKLREEGLDDAAAAVIVDQNSVPIELVPAELRGPAVYKTLTQHAGLEWLVRNVGNLSKAGVLTVQNPETLKLVADRLGDKAALEKSLMHPLKLLAALVVYRSGHGVRGSGSWVPSPVIVDALNDSFYSAFKSITPSGKRLCLGLDVSGSMASMNVNGIAGLRAREACGAMALATAKVEENPTFVAFDVSPYHLALSANQRLDDVVSLLARTGGGGTDCSIPIKWARENKVPVDVFVIYTDSETWYGNEHPVQALDSYRQVMGIEAKLITVAMAANKVSLADCTDSRMLNVVGFDTNTPEIISQFIRGEI